MTRNNDWIVKYLTPTLNGLILAGITGILVSINRLSIDVAVLRSQGENQKQINQDQKEKDKEQDNKIVNIEFSFVKPEEIKVHEKTD